MRVRSLSALVLTLAITTPAWCNCYTVYRGADIVFQSTDAPVDLSQSLADTVPAKFGSGAFMVFTSSTTNCPVVSPASAVGTTTAAVVRTGRSRTAAASAQRQAQAPAPDGAPLQLNNFFVGNDNKMRSQVGGYGTPTAPSMGR